MFTIMKITGRNIYPYDLLIDGVHRKYFTEAEMEYLLREALRDKHISYNIVIT